LKFFEEKLIKIFRSTVIIGTKIKNKGIMITELNIYAALVLAGLY
jgi:hypothetical protein